MNNSTIRKSKYIIIKYLMDRIFAGIGLIIFSPIFIGIGLLIKMEDGWRAPVFFSQKRVGLNKKHFMLYKFRSMKLDAPHNVPTHLLTNSEQYITKVGKFIRKTSLDELPQLWNIFIGDMSAIGPRPALWNQYDLIEERDKYGVYSLKPGLTGWAQINGRDELEISIKAKYDGEYTVAINMGKFRGLIMDLKCLYGTISCVLKAEGFFEGNTKEMKKIS